MKLPAGLKGLLGSLGITGGDAPSGKPLAATTPAPDSTLAALNHMLKGTDLQITGVDKVPGDPDFLPGRAIVVDTSNALSSSGGRQAALLATRHLDSLGRGLGIRITPDQIKFNEEARGGFTLTLSRDGMNALKDSPKYQEALREVTAIKRTF